MSESTIHASAVLVGPKAVLIRGPSGSGKSRLVAAILQASTAGTLPFARLIADDRTLLEARAGALLARPAPALAGLLEVRGVGIQPVAHEAVGRVGLVVQLADPAAQRLPEQAHVVISGIKIPYLGFPPGIDPLPAVLSALGPTR